MTAYKVSREVKKTKATFNHHGHGSPNHSNQTRK